MKTLSVSVCLGLLLASCAVRAGNPNPPPGTMEAEVVLGVERAPSLVASAGEYGTSASVGSREAWCADIYVLDASFVAGDRLAATCSQSGELVTVKATTDAKCVRVHFDALQDGTIDAVADACLGEPVTGSTIVRATVIAAIRAYNKDPNLIPPALEVEPRATVLGDAVSVTLRGGTNAGARVHSKLFELQSAKAYWQSSTHTVTAAYEVTESLQTDEAWPAGDDPSPAVYGVVPFVNGVEFGGVLIDLTRTPATEPQQTNTAPELSGADIGTGPYYTNSSITAIPGSASDDDGDDVTFTYRWFVSGTLVVGQNGDMLSGVYFAKGQSVQAEVTPHDGKASGTPVRSNTVVIQNSLPALFSAGIASQGYGAETTFTAQAGMLVDADGDPVVIEYQWYVNGVAEFGATGATLSGAFSRGDSIFVQLSPHDGQGFGFPVNSESFVVANAKPTFTSVSLGSGPFTETSTITAVVTGWSDADGDPENYVFAWWVNGVQLSVMSGASLTGAHFSKGDTVSVTATAFDGYEAGRVLSAAPVTISNTPPVISSASIGAGPYYTNDTIDVTLGQPGDADEDPVTLAYRWLVDGVVVSGESSTSLPGSRFSKGQTVRVEVTPHDGEEPGAAVLSNEVTIQNSAPSAPEVVIQPEVLDVGSDLWVEITVPAQDADGDALSYTYAWHKNGVEMPYPDETTMVPSSEYEVGEFWSVTVTANDPEGATATATATRTPLLGWARAVAAGSHHTCALTHSGGVKCWGNADFSVLGAYLYSPATRPTDIEGVSEAVDIGAGESHTCALLLSGSIKCWGNNQVGQLGNGMLFGGWSPAATDVVGIADATALTVGARHNCAIISNGSLKCWGWNATAALGVGWWGGWPDRPLTVDGFGESVSAVSAGHYHTCALTVSGAVKCWGDVSFGQTGTGIIAGYGNYISLPVGVPGLEDRVVSIDAGRNHNCALSASGVVKCWGDNSFGQIGVGTYGGAVSTPVEVPGIPAGAFKVVAGKANSCVFFVDGKVSCWGSNAYGEMGEDSNDSRVLTPTFLSQVEGQVASFDTSFHSCIVTPVGKVKCWGMNMLGEVGNREAGYVVPKPRLSVGFSAPVSTVGSGSNHACALQHDGAVSCWGLNSYGQLGDGNRQPIYVPQVALGLASGIVDLSIGADHNCAVRKDGEAYCWGSNSRGELGVNSIGGSTATPLSVTGASDIVAIAAGSSHTCALTQTGGVLCWGDNSKGAVGTGSLESAISQPEYVSGLTSGVMSISAGYGYSCAVMLSGGVKCWGANNMGQLGNGNSPNPATIPSDVVGLSGAATAVAAGYDYTCAVVGGALVCWGSGISYISGDLGPIVLLSSGVVDVSRGCALMDTGGVKCLASGDPSYLRDVIGFSSPIVKINTSGPAHHAIDGAGTVYGWGDNHYGQADSATLILRTPHEVLP